MIVMVEDNPADVHLLEEALREHGVGCGLIVVTDGDKAWKLFDEIEAGSAARPGLVVLDLSLPKRSGREVLRHIKSGSVCGNVPVVILSSSNSPKDQQDTAALGAALYIKKPSDLEDFMKIGLTLKNLLAAAAR